MKKLIITLMIILCTNTACAKIIFKTDSTHYSYIQEEYIVLKNDTLDSITKKFMKKNTYGPREFNEFREGIQLNNIQLFDRDVIENEKLVITYWIKK